MGCLAQQRILIAAIKMDDVHAGLLLVSKETLQSPSHHVKNPLTFLDRHSQAICLRLCLKQGAYRDHPYQLISL